MEKSIDEFYTKGTRLDAACKECIRARKRKKRPDRKLLATTDRLNEIRKIVEDWEIARLKELTARLKEINDRIESRARSPDIEPTSNASVDPETHAVRNPVLINDKPSKS